MLDIHISPQHNLKLDNETNQYAMQTKIVVEISNKSIVPVEIKDIVIVSKKSSFFSGKNKKELTRNTNDVIDAESSYQLTIEGINFIEKRKYSVIVNQEYVSNEI